MSISRAKGLINVLKLAAKTENSKITLGKNHQLGARVQSFHIHGHGNISQIPKLAY